MAGAHVIRPKPWSVLKEEPLVLIGNQWPCLATHSHWASVGGRRSNLDSDARVEESSFPWIRLAGKRTGVGYGRGGVTKKPWIAPLLSTPHKSFSRREAKRKKLLSSPCYSRSGGREGWAQSLSESLERQPENLRCDVEEV